MGNCCTNRADTEEQPMRQEEDNCKEENRASMTFNLGPNWNRKNNEIVKNDISNFNNNHTSVLYNDDGPKHQEV